MFACTSICRSITWTLLDPLTSRCPIVPSGKKFQYHSSHEEIPPGLAMCHRLLGSIILGLFLHKLPEGQSDQKPYDVGHMGNVVRGSRGDEIKQGEQHNCCPNAQRYDEEEQHSYLGSDYGETPHDSINSAARSNQGPA